MTVVQAAFATWAVQPYSSARVNFECVMTDCGEAGQVGVVIPTLNAGDRWHACLDAIKRQTLKPERLLVIDSASTDQTSRLAELAGFEVIRINRSEFNHGGTRQQAVDYLSDCRVIVFLTQDAILATNQSLLEIVKCFGDPSVAVAYGRQLPHEGSTSIEAHALYSTIGRYRSRKMLNLRKNWEARFSSARIRSRHTTE
jgi:glycosyltransferase involved in cell wall biosynthesis